MLIMVVLLRLVRDQAFKAVELFVKKLEVHASTMVDSQIITLTVLMRPSV